MDQNFQTSFIPKKPVIEEHIKTPRRIGLLTMISIFIFFATLISTGALYFYSGVLKKNVTQMENDLNLARNRFEPSKIVQLQTLDKRLRASTEILSKHISISPIFKVLQSLTMKNIAYTKFTYNLDDSKSTKVSVSMSGIAKGYKAIALQSDVFSKNKHLIDPVFSDLTLDDKGNVLFDLDFMVDLDFVNYSKTIEASNGSSPVSLLKENKDFYV